MGILKKVSKAIKKVTKPVTNMVESSGKAVENSVSAVKHLAQGDVSGAISKVGNVMENAGNIASAGTVDLTGRKNGLVNIDADKYADATYYVVKDAADATYDVVKSLLGAKAKDKSTTVNTDIETDGLLQYVSDLRTRKSRRNRASTNNTDGSSAANNKLGGVTALGV